MENELLKAEVSVKAEYVDICDVCQESDDSAHCNVPSATAHCVDCHENMCDECSWHHRRQKLSRQHKVVALSTDHQRKTDWKSSVCDKHGKVKELYCVECKLCICIPGCFEERHQLHKCTTINSAAENFKNRIESEFEKVADSYSYYANRKRRFEQNERDLIEESKILQDAIFRRGAELKDIVEQHTNDLSRELSLISEKRLKQTKEAKEEVEIQQTKIEEFNISCNDLLDSGSAGEICSAADNIMDQAGQIMQGSEKHSRTEDILQSKLPLKLSPTEDLLCLNNVIGTIQGVSYSSIRSTVKLDIGQCSACGVAKKQNKIYVLCHSPSVILVFQNGEPFQLQAAFGIEAIRRPRDIVASEKSKCLYISDGEGRCVWQVGEDLRVGLIRWLTGMGDSFALSLTLDDRLITVRKDQPAKLELYGPHNSSIQNIIQLPRCVANPCHAVETSLGHFLICCVALNKEKSQLYEFKECGHVLRQFNWGMASELGIPRYLSTDVSGRVFVADSWGSRVLLLDFASESVKAIFTMNTEGFLSPWRLCFDAERRHLIVVHGNRTRGAVGVYSLDPE